MTGKHEDCEFSISFGDDRNCQRTAFAYNIFRHTIWLPNCKRTSQNLKWIMESLTHEFLHKLFHEFVDLDTSRKFDNIDKQVSKQIPEFIISSLG